MKQEEFDSDTDEAVTAYRAAEQYYREQPWMDIVLIGSDSLETVKKTHSTYFPGAYRRIVQSITDLDSFLTNSQAQAQGS
ncbi:hypothetical protein [Buchananella felis]|uniref:hypothetical protein n=1 Tax=Buchananella felis TaxID=3231492 RepID=UPI00352748D0